MVITDLDAVGHAVGDAVSGTIQALRTLHRAIVGTVDEISVTLLVTLYAPLRQC